MDSRAVPSMLHYLFSQTALNEWETVIHICVSHGQNKGHFCMLPVGDTSVPLKLESSQTEEVWILELWWGSMGCIQEEVCFGNLVQPLV